MQERQVLLQVKGYFIKIGWATVLRREASVGEVNARQERWQLKMMMV